MPIALGHTACAQAVENLTQLLADTITLRDLYKKDHWQAAGATFYQICCSTNTTSSRTASSMRSPNEFRCWAA
jgi:DNA-binding ferritin-like protein